MHNEGYRKVPSSMSNDSLLDCIMRKTWKVQGFKIAGIYDNF